MIKYFAHKHRFHLFDVELYAAVWFRVFHFILKSMCWFFTATCMLAKLCAVPPSGHVEGRLVVVTALHYYMHAYILHICTCDLIVIILTHFRVLSYQCFEM